MPLSTRSITQPTARPIRRLVPVAGLAMLLGAFALGRGALEHNFMMPVAIGSLGLGVMAGALTLPHDGTEAAATMVGVLILALGHDLNRRGSVHPFGRP